jgi:acetyl-CoA carboxylase carboxyl transferase subunit alpha
MSESQGTWLDFERPLVELEQKISELREFAVDERLEFNDELRRLERKADRLRREIFTNLTRWQARAVGAPSEASLHTRLHQESCSAISSSFTGDRGFGDDRAVVGGMGVFRDRKGLMVWDIRRAAPSKRSWKRNFGMPHPEGYRKALR